MDWTTALFQVIELRSFSSIWYWMAVAVVWSSVSHFVLGVPNDLIQRARRDETGQGMRDLEDIARVNVNRLVHINQTAGAFLVGFIYFLLTALGLIAFYYWFELAQAIFLLALPLSFVLGISMHTAYVMNEAQPKGKELISALFWHRLKTQVVGIIAIFFTAMFGMYQNLDVVRFL
ncbi:component of SufBCD complex [Cognatiyoonia sp.]|uniref:component of SufBCD complex n=1 Tax=Cognatiyoonia sp. TaxID=2211652 RepID=UPI003F69AF48